MIFGVLTALASAVVFGFAAVLQAVASQREETTESLDVWLVVRLLRQPVFVLAIVLNLSGFVAHLLALRSAPLFVVQALVSSSVAVTAALVAWWWRIPLSRLEIVAVAALCVSLAVVTSAAESATQAQTSASGRAWLLVVWAAVALCGWAAGTRHGPWGAALLGFLAGCSFGVGAVCGRVIPSLAPADLVRDPAAYALVLAGGLGFLLYSTALQRGAVLTSTSSMIVAQTAGPALVGVVLLGDSVRPGWWLPAVLGFAVSIAATLALTRHDPAVLESIAAGKG